MTKSSEIIDRLTEALDGLPKELHRAAAFLIENPSEISISSARKIASIAGVKPNTLVRLARLIGLDGYDDLKNIFRNDIRNGDDASGQARFLQSLSKDDALPSLYDNMGRESLKNIERLYVENSYEIARDIAKAMANANRVYVLGVGIATGAARSFAYLAGMTGNSTVAIPQQGMLPIDSLLDADENDILVAMTFKPFRREVVDAVDFAHSVSMPVVAISDSPASPILKHARQKLIIPTKTPQFFSSMVAVMAMLETIVAYLVAESDENTITKIELFHQRRVDRDVYWTYDHKEQQ